MKQSITIIAKEPESCHCAYQSECGDQRVQERPRVEVHW